MAEGGFLGEVTAGTAAVHIVPQFKGFREKLRAGVESNTRGAVRNMGKIGAGVVAGLAAVGIASVHMADKFEESHARAEVAFRNAGKNIDDYASQISAASKRNEDFGFTNAQTQEALARLTTSTGKPEKALQLMGLAADLAKARNMDLADSAGLLGKVMAGNTRLLKMMGIDLNVTAGGAAKVAAAQKALKKAEEARMFLLQKLHQKQGLSLAQSQQLAKAETKVADARKAGGKKLTDAERNLADLEARVHEKRKLSLADQQALTKANEKVTDAQKKLNDTTETSDKILKALGDRFKGSARQQAETFAGKMKALHARIEDLLVAIGLKLIPVIMKVVGVVIGAVHWFGKHTLAAKILGAMIGGFLAASVLVFLANLAKTAVEGVAHYAKLIAAGVKWVVQTGIGIAKNIALYAWYYGTLAAQWIAQEAKKFGAMIAEGAAWVVANAIQVATVVAAWVAANIAMIAATAGIALLITGLVAAGIWMAHHWKAVWRDIKGAAGAAWHFLRDRVIHPLEQAIGWFVSMNIRAFKTWVDVFLTSVGFILHAARVAAHWLSFGFADPLKGADEAFQGFKQSVDDTLSGMANDAMGWGSATGKNLAKGLTSANDNVTIAADKVAASLARHLKPGSPTKEGPLSTGGGTGGWGHDLVAHLATGMTRGTGRVRGAAGEVAKAAIPRFHTGKIPGPRSAEYLALVRGQEEIKPTASEGGSLRFIRGELDITPEGRAFIRGVALDVVDEDRDLRAVAGRMRR